MRWLLIAVIHSVIWRIISGIHCSISLTACSMRCRSQNLRCCIALVFKCIKHFVHALKAFLRSICTALHYNAFYPVRAILRRGERLAVQSVKHGIVNVILRGICRHHRKHIFVQQIIERDSVRIYIRCSGISSVRMLHLPYLRGNKRLSSGQG